MMCACESTFTLTFCVFTLNTKVIFFQAIDSPDFSESELKELAVKFPCRVELFHSNVCYGVEKSWPKRISKKSKYEDLLTHQKRKLQHMMERNAVYLYNKYVDLQRLERRRKRITNNTLSLYYTERFLRNRFQRIKSLGDAVHTSNSISVSDSSWTTAVDQEMEIDLLSDVSTEVRNGSTVEVNEDCDVEIEENVCIFFEISSDEGGQEDEGQLREHEQQSPDQEPAPVLESQQGQQKNQDQVEKETLVAAVQEKLNESEGENTVSSSAQIDDQSENIIVDELALTAKPRRKKKVRFALDQDNFVTHEIIPEKISLARSDRNVTRRRPPRETPMKLRSGRNIASEIAASEGQTKINTVEKIMKLRSGTTVSPISRPNRSSYTVPKAKQNMNPDKCPAEQLEKPIQTEKFASNTSFVDEQYSYQMSENSVSSSFSGDYFDNIDNKPILIPPPRISTSDIVVINSQDVIKFRHNFEDNLEFLLNPPFRMTRASSKQWPKNGSTDGSKLIRKSKAKQNAVKNKESACAMV